MDESSKEYIEERYRDPVERKENLRKYIMEYVFTNHALVKTPTYGGRKSLHKCTVSELKEKAKKRRIKITGLKKDEIIAKLRK